DPSSPARLGHVDTASEGYGVAVMGSFAYVVGEAMPLTIVGAGRPEAPVIVKDFEATGWAESVQIVGQRAYLAGEYLGLLVLDVTNPFEPYRLAQYPYGTGQDEGWDLQVSGNHAYLARGSEGLIIFELGGQPPIESVTRSGQNLILKWTGAPGLRLQRTDSLTTPNWIDVPGSDGQS